MVITYTFEKIRITGIDTTKSYTDANFPIQGTKRILCNGVDRIHKKTEYKEYISLPVATIEHNYTNYKNAMLNALDSLGITYTFEDKNVSTNIYGTEDGTLVLNVSFPTGVGFAQEDEEGNIDVITVTEIYIKTVKTSVSQTLYTSAVNQDGESLIDAGKSLLVYGTTTEY